MADDFSLNAKITADNSGFSKAIKQCNNSLSGFSKSLVNMHGTINKVFAVAGIGVGIKALSDFGKKAVSAADSANKQFKILSGTLKATGANAWTSAEDMNKMAKSYAESTNYSVTEINKMQSVLLGFKDITGETFKEASDAVLDMATVMGMDLTSAVQTVGKALDDPVKGLDSLRRQGFAFTDEQKKMLEMLVKTGDKMKAQQIILEELSTTYSGAAKQGQSAFAQFQHSMNEFYETLGNKLIPLFESSAKSVTKLTSKITDFVNSGIFDKIINIIINLNNKVKQVFSSILSYISDVFTEIKSIVNIVDFSPFVSVLDTLIGVVKAFTEEVKKRIENTKEQFAKIKEALNISDSIDTEKIANTINKAIDIFWFLHDEIFKISEDIRALIVDKIIEIWEKIKEIFNKTQEALSHSESDVKSWGDYIYSILNNVFRVFQDLLGMISALIHGDWAVAWEYAKLVVLRVADSIVTSLDTMVTAFQEKITEILNIAKMVANFVPGGGAIKLALESIKNFVPHITETKENVEELISSTEKKIEELTGHTADITIKDLNGISNASEGLFEKITSGITDTGTKTRDELDRTKYAAQETGEAIKDGLNIDIVRDFKLAWDEFGKDMKKKAEDWKPFFKETFGQIGEIGKGMFETIGQSLAGNADAWNDYGAQVVEIIAQILEGLAAQLSALAVAKAMAYSYGEAAAAAGGAAAALVAAGTLKAVAANIKNVSKASQEAVGSLKKFKDLLNDIQIQSTSEGAVNLGTSFIKYSEAIKTAQKNLENYFEVWANEYFFTATPEAVRLKLVKALEEAEQAYANAVNTTTKNLQEEGEAIQKNTSALFELYGGLDASSRALIKTDIWKSLTEQAESAVIELMNIGKDLGSKFVDSIVDGATSTDFRKNLRDYIKKEMIQLAVYTASFQETFADMTQRLVRGIALNNETIITNSVSDITRLYNETVAQTEYVNRILNRIFSDIHEETEETFEEFTFDFTSQLGNITDEIKKILGDLQNSAITIGSTLSSAIISGMTSEDMAGEIKSYLKENFLRLQVYSKYADELSKLGEQISEAITTGATGKIKSIKKEIEGLYQTIEKETKEFSKVLDDVFGTTVEEISQTIEETVEETLSRLETKIESFKDTLSDLGGDISDEIVNGLSEGLTGADFMSKMKDYLRKMVIQSVVYTQSLKSEIEAIGKVISEGITNGFTETGLHEIRRDLSYVFDQANKAIDKVDSMFSNIFDVTGYATGTQNATAGLHLVGEAGPELVRFRGGEQVLNAQNTNKALEGVGKTNNFNVTFNNLQDTSAFAMMQQFRDYNRQLAVDGIF